MLYSLKMRASRETPQGEEHVSGAEKILPKEELPEYAAALLSRALHHAKGEADFVNVKAEAVSEADIEYLDALPVGTVEVDTAEAGRQCLTEHLAGLGIENAEAILAKLPETYGMRGAMLLDVDTLERLEPDRARGIRATYMDAERVAGVAPSDAKNHFQEAIVLATKVANAPHIVAELCISDDPDYVTGYIASKEIGYLRITKLKAMGSPDGGRIFLFRGTQEEARETIDYLEKQHVLVRGMPLTPSAEPTETNEGTHEEGGEAVSFPAYLEHVLKEKEAQGLTRHIVPMNSASPHSHVERRKALLFASNNYLGLAEDARLKEAAAEAATDGGTGTGGSRLTTGTRPLHAALERELAAFCGQEAGLLFATGYMANVGTVSALGTKGTVIFSDEKNHASIIDGCRLSHAETVVYRHSDMHDLEKKLRAHAPCRALIVTDSVFSMDGDIAPLPQILAIARRYGALTMVDEAHATGVIGATGHGIVEYFHLQEKPDIIMGTLSKALGSEGGYVCASHLIIDYLVNTARSFIFSTSQSPANVAAARRALAILREDAALPRRLQRNIRLFSQALSEEGVEAESETAIFPILLGEAERAVAVADALSSRGLLASAIRYPTVPKGEARLRVALSAAHTEEDLRTSAKLIGETLRKIS